MTQVDLMLFLRLWVQSIQSLPNPVTCFPNSRILFQIPPDMYSQDKKIILNPINHIFSLIFHLSIDSSPWFLRKNKVFQCKTFSNLVFGDDFAFDGTRWLSYDFIFVSGVIWLPPPCWRTKERPSNNQLRSKECGSLLTQNEKFIRMSLLLGNHYSKHSRIRSSKYCCKMMWALYYVKKCIILPSSLNYIEQLSRL